MKEGDSCYLVTIDTYGAKSTSFDPPVSHVKTGSCTNYEVIYNAAANSSLEDCAETVNMLTGTGGRQPYFAWGGDSNAKECR
jgi:hypothetical protein